MAETAISTDAKAGHFSLTKLAVVCFGVGFAVIALFSGPPANEVRREDYGDDWPFAGYERGTLDCSYRNILGYDRYYVTIELGNRKYALNGTAMGTGRYLDARTLMRRNPQYGTFDLGATTELIQRGLDLCR